MSWPELPDRAAVPVYPRHLVPVLIPERTEPDEGVTYNWVLLDGAVVNPEQPWTYADFTIAFPNWETELALPTIMFVDVSLPAATIQQCFRAAWCARGGIWAQYCIPPAAAV